MAGKKIEFINAGGRVCFYSFGVLFNVVMVEFFRRICLGFFFLCVRLVHMYLSCKS